MTLTPIPGLDEYDYDFDSPFCPKIPFYALKPMTTEQKKVRAGEIRRKFSYSEITCPPPGLTYGVCPVELRYLTSKEMENIRNPPDLPDCPFGAYSQSLLTLSTSVAVGSGSNTDVVLEKSKSGVQRSTVSFSEGVVDDLSQGPSAMSQQQKKSIPHPVTLPFEGTDQQQGVPGPTDPISCDACKAEATGAAPEDCAACQVEAEQQQRQSQSQAGGQLCRACQGGRNSAPLPHQVRPSDPSFMQEVSLPPKIPEPEIPQRPCPPDMHILQRTSLSEPPPESAPPTEDCCNPPPPPPKEKKPCCPKKMFSWCKKGQERQTSGEISAPTEDEGELQKLLSHHE